MRLSYAVATIGATAFIGYALTLNDPARPTDTPVSTSLVPMAVGGPPVASNSSSAVETILDKYNGGNRPAMVSLTSDQRQRAKVALDAASRAGFRGHELIVMVSIAGRESNWHPQSHGVNARTRDNSYGLWQINMLGSAGPRWAAMFGIDHYDELLDPYVNAHAAMVMCHAMISYGKTCFHGWGPYKGKPPLGVAAKYVEAVYSLALSEGYLVPTLRPGDSGDDVKALQRQLNAVDDRVCGDSVKCKRKYRVYVDGDFGDETKEAVIMFQRDQGLRCDGEVGPATRRQLADPDPSWQGCA